MITNVNKKQIDFDDNVFILTDAKDESLLWN